MRCARSTAFCTISAFWWRFGAMVRAASVTRRNLLVAREAEHPDVRDDPPPVQAVLPVQDVPQEIRGLQEALHEDVPLPARHQLHRLGRRLGLRGRVDEPTAREVDRARPGRLFDVGSLPDEDGQRRTPSSAPPRAPRGSWGPRPARPRSGGACRARRVDDVGEAVHGSRVYQGCGREMRRKKAGFHRLLRNPPGTAPGRRARIQYGKEGQALFHANVPAGESTSSRHACRRSDLNRHEACASPDFESGMSAISSRRRQVEDSGRGGGSQCAASRGLATRRLALTAPGKSVRLPRGP